MATATKGEPIVVGHWVVQPVLVVLRRAAYVLQARPMHCIDLAVLVEGNAHRSTHAVIPVSAARARLFVFSGQRNPIYRTLLSIASLS
jgi:hypothetical protein